mmetsp:Transcript_2580/g.3972  ORF Transcript_2580/g.3972 Transcript_2580/m.3972 type:complete len:102 (-) Transcript_2580:2333-2638(-)
MSEESICIRIKRKNQTFFITTTKSNTISFVKSQISEAISCVSESEDTVIPEKMRLFSKKNGSQFLLDVATVGDHDSIKDDSELYLVFREEGDSWEAIEMDE